MAISLYQCRGDRVGHENIAFALRASCANASRVRSTQHLPLAESRWVGGVGAVFYKLSMGVNYLSQKLIFSVIIIINISRFVQTIAKSSVMTQTIVNLSIPLTTIIEAISCLDLEAKHELYKLLEQQIQEAEANLSEVDIYDWGINGQPQGKPVEYIPGLGLAVIGGKDVPA